jgi:hypothetical protein
MYNTSLCIIRQKHHLPSEQAMVWDGELAGVVETVNVVKNSLIIHEENTKETCHLLLPLLSIEVCLLGWFSKIINYSGTEGELRRNLAGFPTLGSILSKIDGTSAYIAISTQVIHLLEDMNPWQRYHLLQCFQRYLYHVHLRLHTARKVEKCGRFR